MAAWVAGIPETKGSVRAVAKNVIKRDNPREKAWNTAIGWAARAQMRARQPIPTPVAIQVEFFLPPAVGKKHQRDIDKMLRSALDALTGIAYTDDVLVKRIETEKFIVGDPGEVARTDACMKEPGMWIEVFEWKARRA